MPSEVANVCAGLGRGCGDWRVLALPEGIQSKDSKATYWPDERQLPHTLSLFAAPQLRFWQIIAYGLSLPVGYIYKRALKNYPVHSESHQPHGAVYI